MIGIFAFSQQGTDSISERISELDGRLNSIDERVIISENDLFKLTKIKVSGYIQAQFESFQPGLLLKENDPENSFFIRRARIKFTYEFTDGIRFVLQPDLSTGNLSLKDAYAVAYYPKLKSLSLWAGQFNRPNYEVEYSSSQREVFERSRVIRIIYPGEREIGAKLEFTPLSIPLKLQAAILNGNFAGKEAIDIDTRKDMMARAVYSFHFPASGIGVDIGAHTYYGGLMAKNKYVSDFDGTLDSTTSNTGSYLDKKWAGAESQIYLDLLGGLALKAEYIGGRNAFAGDSRTNPYKIRKFNGYYLYLIKNIGTKHQAVGRYDYFDPNTTVSGDGAGKEPYYKTLTLAWQYYLNDNIRVSLNYEILKNEITGDFTEDIEDNRFGVRLQAKF
jgi:phosphate-selective porin